MRKIIQIAVMPESENYWGSFLALCDDGTFWDYKNMNENKEWTQLPPIPQDEVSEVFDKLPEDILDEALEQGNE